MFSTLILIIAAFNHFSSSFIFIQSNVLEMQFQTILKIKSKRFVEFGFNERVLYLLQFSRQFPGNIFHQTYRLIFDWKMRSKYDALGFSKLTINFKTLTMRTIYRYSICFMSRQIITQRWIPPIHMYWYDWHKIGNKEE